MYDTLKRLEEAKILLEQAISRLDDHASVRTNLNAFIAAARSITWIMKKEFSKNPQFNTWYSSKEVDMQNNDIFEFFKNLRNTSVKEGSVVGNTQRITTTFDGSFSAGGTYDIPLGRVDEKGNLVIDNASPILINGKPTTKVKAHTRCTYYFEERPSDDAIDLCKRYLASLESIVAECYSKFSST